MALNNKFCIYADLTCPFCYALNERLNELSYDDCIEWRFVEHAPNAKFDELNLSEQSEIAQEIVNLRQKASEIIVNIPQSRPNSHNANLLLIEAAAEDPRKAQNLRNELYHALWVEGQDISEPNVLRALCNAVGLTNTRISENTQMQLKRQQNQWEEGDYSKRIPVIFDSQRQRKFLGLPDIKSLKAFLQGNYNQNLFDSSTVCEFIPRQRITIIDKDPSSLSTSIAFLQIDYHVEIVSNGEKAITKALSHPQPDLIILDINLPGSNGFEVCHCLKATEFTRNIPVIFLSEQNEISVQMKAFGCGASDYIVKPFSPPVLKCRIDTHLKLKRVTELLDKMARIDSVTELPNRREFEKVLEIEWQRCRRTQMPLSILMIDIDYFKRFNDYYGHTAGDKCLKKVAQTLWVNTNRRTDFIGRYGGEEFVAILPSTDKEGAIKLASRYIKAIQELRLDHAASFVSDCVTISIGITTDTPQGLKSPIDVLNSADSALYKAKDNGRNQLFFNKHIKKNNEFNQAALNPNNAIS